MGDKKSKKDKVKEKRQTKAKKDKIDSQRREQHQPHIPGAT